MDPFTTLVVLVLIVTLFVFWRLRRKGDGVFASTAGSVACGLLSCMAMTIAMVLSGVIVPIAPQTYVVSTTDHSTVTADFPRMGLRDIVWGWDGRLDGEIRSYAPVEHTASISVNPISDNPKVRRLTIQVTVQGRGTIEKAQTYYAFLERPVLGFEDSLDHNEILRFYLYEFAEQYSRELGELYNPADPNQQERFRGIVRQFFDGLLEEARTGLSLTFSEFQLGSL